MFYCQQLHPSLGYMLHSAVGYRVVVAWIPPSSSNRQGAPEKYTARTKFNFLLVPVGLHLAGLFITLQPGESSLPLS